MVHRTKAERPQKRVKIPNVFLCLLLQLGFTAQGRIGVKSSEFKFHSTIDLIGSNSKTSDTLSAITHVVLRVVRLKNPKSYRNWRVRAKHFCTKLFVYSSYDTKDQKLPSLFSKKHMNCFPV